MSGPVTAGGPIPTARIPPAPSAAAAVAVGTMLEAMKIAAIRFAIVTAVAEHLMAVKLMTVKGPSGGTEGAVHAAHPARGRVDLGESDPQ